MRHLESRAAARLACAALAHISVRDRLARDALAACTSRPIEIVPDPAFLLEPASHDAATALLKRVDLPVGRPLIVATMRRWFHERGGFVPNALKLALGIKLRRDESRFGLLLDAVAEGLAVLARRLDAGVLLLPGYNVAHEADDVACAMLLRRISGVAIRLVRVADPALYKAVLAHATVVVSARMHPLILASGMGVPFVGLSYNPKFDGLFDQLGLAARSLPLDLCPQVWGASTLVAAAEAALEAQVDLRQRSEALAAIARRATLDTVFGTNTRRQLETVRA